MYIGLSKKDAVECFEFEKAKNTKMTPIVVKEESGVKAENVISGNDTECFAINRITLNDGRYKLNIEDSYGVYIVTDGCGELFGDNYKKKIKKGDYFFVPACLMDRFSVRGKLQIVECW